jgi:hypothetical protein
MATMAKQETERRPMRQAEALQFTEIAYLCNITEQEFVQQFNFGEIRVAGCAADEEYKVTKVEWRAERPTAEGAKPVEIGANAIAKDVARLCNGDIGEVSYAGIFVIANGDKPSEGELRQAHQKLAKRYEHCVANARGDWERSKRTDWITDEQRRAARYLNLTAEAWMSQAQGQALCEGCGIAHMPGIAKCGHCGAILDFEKAKRLGLLPPHMMKEPEAKKI